MNDAGEAPPLDVESVPAVPDDLWKELRALIERHDPRGATGRKRTDPRSLLDAIVYRTITNCAWGALPGRFPPPATVYRTWRRWSERGLLDAIWALMLQNDQAAGNEKLRRVEAALVDSEARFARIFERSPVGIILHRATDHLLLRANPSACTILGRSEAELRALSWADLVGPEGASPEAAQREPALASESAASARVLRLLRPDGDTRYVRAVATPMPTDSGAPPLILTQLVDVTEERLATEALRRSELLVQSAFEGAAFGIAVSTADGARVRINPAGCALLGKSEAELRAMPVGALTSPAQVPEYARRRAQLVNGEIESFEFEREAKYPDGSTRWLRSVHTLTQATSDEPRYVISQFQDVTAQRQAEAALRASEARFAGIFAHAGCGIAAWALDGWLLEMNGAGRAIFDLGAEDHRRVHWLEITSPADLPKVRAAGEGLLAGHTRIVPIEGSFRTEAGEDRQIEMEISLVRDDHGAPAYLLSTFRDVTAARAAVAAVQERDARIRSVFLHSPLGMAHLPPDGFFSDVNPAFSAMLGYERDELIGHSWRNISRPDDLEANFVRGMQGLRGEHETLSWENRFLRKDGSELVGEITLSAVRDEAGNSQYVIMYILDLSAVRQAEAALRQSEARFRAAFRHVPACESVSSPDGRWIVVNPALCALLGYSEEELIGRSWLEFTHPADRARQELFRAEVLACAGDVRRLQKRYLHRDGHAIPVEIYSTLVSDDADRPAYIVAQIEPTASSPASLER